MITSLGGLVIPKIGNVFGVLLQEEEAELANFVCHLNTHDLALTPNLSDRVAVGKRHKRSIVDIDVTIPTEEAFVFVNSLVVEILSLSFLSLSFLLLALLFSFFFLGENLATGAR